MYHCCSEFRDVPDAQEVFADAGTDQSVIVEVLQHSAGVGDADAAAFHFNDIAESNGVAAGDVTLQPSADVDIAACELPLLREALEGEDKHTHTHTRRHASAV